MTRTQALSGLKTESKRNGSRFNFPRTHFIPTCIPFEQAVQYIAKQYFLTELYLLRDPALCSLIDQYIEMDNQTGKVLSHPRTINIENVLMEIADFVQPYQGRILSFANLFTPANHQIQPRTSLHHAINQAFIKCGIDSNGLAEIKSKQDVIQVMKMINDFYRQNMDSEAGKTSAMHKRS